MHMNIRLTSMILFTSIFVAYSTSFAFSQQPTRTAGEARQVQPQPTLEYMIGKSGQLMRGDQAEDLKDMRKNLQELKDEKSALTKKLSQKNASERVRVTSQRSQGASGSQESTLNMLNLQQKMNRHSQPLQTRSNILFQQNKTQKCLIQKNCH